MEYVLIVAGKKEVALWVEQVLKRNGYSVTGITANCFEARKSLQTIHPDLIICDINIEGEFNGLELLKELTPGYGIPFLFISACSETILFKEPKKPAPFCYHTLPLKEELFIEVVKRVLLKYDREQDRTKPTDRELDVIKLAAHGYTTKQIADELSVTHHAIDSHRKNLMTRYKVKSMIEMVCMATARGWIEYENS